MVVRFANVNGTGSASANNLLAKAVFRMGIPVSPKNIFLLIFKVFLLGMKSESMTRVIWEEEMALILPSV